ncbi:MAG: hypothetical protein ACUVTD_07700 [Nitrososphaerales archaeon]
MLKYQELNLNPMLELLARIAGKSLAEALMEEHKIKERNLETLKLSFEKLFTKFMNFDAKIVNGKLMTSSDCPFYGFYKDWCEKGCVSFVESFAKAINKEIEIRRIIKAPEAEKCRFEFYLK